MKKKQKVLSRTSIYHAPIEKPYIKLLNNIDTLHELSVYNELGMVKTSKAFK